MMKDFNVSAPLKKEMNEIVEKRRYLAFGSDEWNSLNARFNELLILWSESRIDGMLEDIKRKCPA